MNGPDIRIGRVVSVTGSQVVALISDPEIANGAEPPPGLQIGSLVKMKTPSSIVFGMINGLDIPVPAIDSTKSEMKVAELEVVGEAVNGVNGTPPDFQRGVSVFPGLGDDVFAATPDDLSLVYVRPDSSNLRVGTIHQDSSLPAYVVTDDLLGHHFAVVGTTGTGKSCAVALILHRILDQNANAHVVVLDPHNEYAQAFGERAEILNPENLQLPYWLFNLEEIMEVVLGGEGDASGAESTILGELIQTAKQNFSGNEERTHYLTVDTPVPYSLEEITRLIDEEMGKHLGKPDNLAPYMRLKSRLNALERDQRYAFMFDDLLVRDNISEILSRIFRVPVNGKPITIINLSGVPSEILNVVVSLLCRLTFDIAVWSDRSLPIMLVCEEAHRYAPQDTALGFEPTKRALARIAKEGRKYGISLCVVSQRPAELAPSVLSQCNTIFAMRMSNRKDQTFVDSAMSETTPGLFDALSSLRNAEAIVVGEGVTVPMRMHFDHLPADQRPMSATASFSAEWQQDNDVGNLMDEIVDRWRRQSH